MLSSYSLREDQTELCPFYVNHGFIAATPALLSELGRQHAATIEDVRSVINNGYCHQIALSLAVERGELPHELLPMRFNYPNDPVCDRLHPEELQRVMLMHYLRTSHFDRHRIFAHAEDFDRFMVMPLSGSNARFRDRVRELTDGRYPFTRP